MNYQIIQDPQLLREFIDSLPDLTNEETYLVALFARKKYVTSGAPIKRDKNQLKRFTTSKELMFAKLRQLETEEGTYLNEDGDAIAQDSLAVYISVNPRSQTKAAKTLLIDLAQRIGEPYQGYSLHQLALTHTHKARSRKVYVDLDFDHADYETTMRQVAQHINLDAVRVLRTRGGFHVLVEVAKIQKCYVKTWYPRISSLPGCDVMGDMLLPVAGCCQGGFVPYFERELAKQFPLDVTDQEISNALHLS